MKRPTANRFVEAMSVISSALARPEARERLRSLGHTDQAIDDALSITQHWSPMDLAMTLLLGEEHGVLIVERDDHSPLVGAQ